MSRRYDLAIFDYDGTLADSLPWFVTIVNELAQRHHFRRVEQPDIDILRELGAHEILKRLQISRWRMPFIARDLRRLARRDRSLVKLFPGVEDMLARVHGAGIKVVIVSSNSADNIEDMLGKSASRYVDHYYGGARVFGKARMHRRVLDNMQIGRERAISIGDEIRDLEAARTVGIHFGAVGWGYTTAPALFAHKPDLELTSIADIADKLVGVQ